MILDWRPSVAWGSIEDCRCDAFFVWSVLLDGGRLDRIPPEERARLHARILGLRVLNARCGSTPRTAHRTRP
jgi:hypothetical protein